MELLKFDADWFLSEPGRRAFSDLKSLEDRSIFLYSCLKSMVSSDFDKDHILFKTAFFLADAVAGSSLSYGSYPDLLDPKKNPYVAYLVNAARCPDAQTLYCVFLSVLHGIADPFKKNEWIYSPDICDPDKMNAMLEKKGRNFCHGSVTTADPSAFEIDPALQIMQIKLIWLFGQHEVRR